MNRMSGQRPWRRYYRTISVPNPAAGVDWAQSVPGSEIWHLRSIFAQLQTSAVVATRVPNISISDGDATWLVLPSSVTQTAGQTLTLAWASLGAGASAGSRRVSPLPDLIIEPGGVIASLTDLIDVGDQWSAIYLRVLATVFQGNPFDFDDVPEMMITVAGSITPSGE